MRRTRVSRVTDPLIPTVEPIDALPLDAAALRAAADAVRSIAYLVLFAAPGGEGADPDPSAPGDAREAGWLAEAARVLDAAGAAADLPALVAAYGPPTSAGSTAVIPLADGPIGRIVLANAGDGSARAVRSAAAAALRAAGEPATIWLHPIGIGPADAVVEGALLATPTLHWGAGSEPLAQPPIRYLGAPDGSLFRLGTECARATLTARALANTPSNLKSPEWLAGVARQIARASGVRAKVWTPKALAEGGFGGILAVGQGSATPPRMVELTYAPRGADGPPVVLVGKGITFDTGGVNVKPAAGMLTMKTDMSGAAIVLAVLAGCRALGVRRRVIGLMPLAENAIGGNSYRPSDVITQYGGRTVEIGNTDAEGRIVLADAIAYAVETHRPAALIDIATLTGAARVALASSYAASYGTDDALHDAIRRACAAAGEPLWPLPLVEDYRSDLDSDVADLSHIGSKGGPGAGSIIAALFLREFTGDVPWVHLDIAGVGRSESDTGLLAKGATGYGARGLLRWLLEETPGG